MKHGEHREPPRLSQVVHRAVEVCDGNVGIEGGLGDLYVRFEDRDEPITAIEDIEQTMAEAVGALDVDGTDPQLAMAAAVTVYLAHRRDELDDDPAKILRLAARAEFDGSPPAHVAQWLAEIGVEV